MCFHCSRTKQKAHYDVNNNYDYDDDDDDNEGFSKAL